PTAMPGARAQTRRRVAARTLARRWLLRRAGWRGRRADPGGVQRARPGCRGACRCGTTAHRSPAAAAATYRARTGARRTERRRAVLPHALRRPTGAQAVGE